MNRGGAVLRWLAGALVVAVGTLALVLVIGGGAPSAPLPGLPDAGALTGWGLPVVRLLVDLLAVLTVGLLLVPALLLPSAAAVLSRPGFAAAQTAAGAALLWAVLTLVELLLTVSDVLGIRPGRLDPVVVRSFVTQVPQGRALVAQALLALVVAGLARSALRSRRALGAMAVAVVAVVPPALTGHSAASGNHELAVASLMVHLLCATVWTGGLLALAWMAFGAPARDTGPDATGLGLALERFSTVALVCWVGVGVSGVVNAGVRVGVGELLSTPYGRLVLAKATALLVLGGFGWWHRRHTVGRLRVDPGRARPVFLRVAAAELVVMGATFGLAVGLSRTPTPATGLPDTSPATELLGFALPPAPTVARLVTGFVPDGFAITFLLLAVLAYAAGLRVLHRRGDRWPVGRTLAWYAGLLVAAWSTLGGLGLYSHVLFSAHMVAHMTLSMLAPVGLVLGAPITLALRALPGRRTPQELGLRQLLQATLDSRVLHVLTHPVVAAVLFVASLYVIYFTGLFDVLMSEHLGHVLMELHFLAVGCLFFWVLIGVDPGPRRLHPLARLGLLLLVMPFHAFFAITIMNTDTVFAHPYFAALHRSYSTDLLADQQLGGAIAWALGEVPLVLVVIALFVQWVRSDRREAGRADRNAERRSESGSDLDRYNAYLARLSGQHDADVDR